MHWGVDYGNTPADNTIVASGDGKVIIARNMTGYGNTIMIEHMIHGRLHTTVYAHLASFNVKLGQMVRQGQKIAVKGTTGNSTGIHLHFELHRGAWNNKFTNAVDPLKHVIDEETIELQTLLKKAGYRVEVDGINGSNTTAALKKFQEKAKLTVDGLYGPASKKALLEATKPKEVKPVKKTRFSDVPETHPAYKDAETVAKAGIMLGYPDGTIGIDKPLTRRDLISVVARLIEKG